MGGTFFPDGDHVLVSLGRNFVVIIQINLWGTKIDLLKTILLASQVYTM